LNKIQTYSTNSYTTSNHGLGYVCLPYEFTSCHWLQTPGESQDQYQQVYEQDQQPHEGKFSHELIAGAASFAGFKAFEDHQRKEGNPLLFPSPATATLLTVSQTGKEVKHAFAKELLAGFVGGEVDKLAETKGEDFVDRERSKHEAKKRADQMYDDHYGNQDQYDPNNQSPPQHLQEQFGNRW
jgi:hypothetical protein